MKSYRKNTIIKTQLAVVVAINFIALLISIPIYYLEKNAGSETIVSLADSLWFTFTSLSTIGYGDYTVTSGLSKILIVIAFGLTRVSFLMALLTISGRIIGGRKSYEMSMDERLRVIENELKQTRSVAYNLIKLVECDIKTHKSHKNTTE